MAAIFPSNVTHFEFKTATRGELKTFALLKNELPDDYTVFHNVHCTNHDIGVQMSLPNVQVKREARKAV